MISFAEAYRIVMESAFTLGDESIPFDLSEGRVLAEDICSDSDMPPFNRAAVDGFACRLADLASELDVVEVIPAGRVPEKIPGVLQCSKIMTGAIVPEGCDIVFMVEDSELLPTGKIRFTGSGIKQNIAWRGEDVKIGETVLKAGKIIKPQDIAILASFGHISVRVRSMPSVGIISTGDEIVEPAVIPATSQIRNSNAYQLVSQVNRAGASPRYYGIVPDSSAGALKVIHKALNENDIVLLTGGVSMGDYDFVPSFLTDEGVKILFDKVNVQPGKPTTFGVHPRSLVFGLPGNPVSAFVQFETLVRPVIHRMMQSEWKTDRLSLPLAVRYERKSSSRMGWVPSGIENGRVVPVDYHGSAHIAALSFSEGIFAVNAGINTIEAGELVEFHSFKY